MNKARRITGEEGRDRTGDILAVSRHPRTDRALIVAVRPSEWPMIRLTRPRSEAIEDYSVYSIHLSLNRLLPLKLQAIRWTWRI